MVWCLFFLNQKVITQRHTKYKTPESQNHSHQVLPQDYTPFFTKKQERYIMCSNQREINSSHPAGSPSQNDGNNNNNNTNSSSDPIAILDSEGDSFTQRRRRSLHPFGADTGTYPMGVNQSSYYENHHDRASRVLEIIDSVLSILEQDDHDGIFEWASSNSTTTTTTTTSKLNNGRQARQ
jgi:hypothetical protein